MTDEQLDQLYDDTAAEKLQDDIGDLCTGHPVDEVVSVLITLLSNTFDDFGAPETADPSTPARTSTNLPGEDRTDGRPLTMEETRFL